MFALIERYFFYVLVIFVQVVLQSSEQIVVFALVSFADFDRILLVLVLWWKIRDEVIILKIWFLTRSFEVIVFKICDDKSLNVPNYLGSLMYDSHPIIDSSGFGWHLIDSFDFLFHCIRLLWQLSLTCRGILLVLQVTRQQVLKSDVTVLLYGFLSFLVLQVVLQTGSDHLELMISSLSFT